MTLHQALVRVAATCLVPGLAALAQSTPASANSFPVLATFAGDPGVDHSVSPNGRLIAYTRNNALQLYHVPSKRSIQVTAASAGTMSWSAASDRLVWAQPGDAPNSSYVWTIALDPATGAQKGTAQRVSVDQGSWPAISVDGQWIAYTASMTGETAAPIKVVPISGGPARVVATVRGAEELWWSADGRTIYLWGQLERGKTWGTIRARLDGRQPDMLPGSEDHWFAGMTRDRRHLIVVPAKATVAEGSRAVVLDTTGKEVGRAPLPVGAITQYSGVIGDSAFVWSTSASHRELVIRSVNGGAARRVPLVGESNQFPQWSPDGRLIAFQVVEGKRHSLALMNADGTNLRVMRDTDVRADPFWMHWSPDAKSIGFTTKDWHTLQRLDVATQTLSTMLRDTTVRVGNWTWSDDARSITAVLLASDASRSTIESIAVDGSRRKLTNIAALPGSGRGGFQFVSGSTVMTRFDSGSFLAPLNGAAPRRLADVQKGSIAFNVAVSRDRQLLGVPFRGPDDGLGKLELIAVANGSSRIIDLPFWFLGPATPTFVGAGKSMLIAGRQSSDSSGANVYLVPTDGSPAKVVASLGAAQGREGFAASPDGSSMVYSIVRGASKSLLYVDLRNAIPRPSSGSVQR